ncbi:glycosyltransferase family 2 protein [Shigella flexneri]
MWIVGGVYFWVYRERHWPWGETTSSPVEDNPSISIIIPCFNEEKNVEETIHAALAQRYENIEVIAVNDGSTDKTRAIRIAWLHKFPFAGNSSGAKTGESHCA